MGGNFRDEISTVSSTWRYNYLVANTTSLA